MAADPVPRLLESRVTLGAELYANRFGPVKDFVIRDGVYNGHAVEVRFPAALVDGRHLKPPVKSQLREHLLEEAQELWERRHDDGFVRTLGVVETQVSGEPVPGIVMELLPRYCDQHGTTLTTLSRVFWLLVMNDVAGALDSMPGNTFHRLLTVYSLRIAPDGHIKLIDTGSTAKCSRCAAEANQGYPAQSPPPRYSEAQKKSFALSLLMTQIAFHEDGQVVADDDKKDSENTRRLENAANRLGWSRLPEILAGGFGPADVWRTLLHNGREFLNYYLRLWYDSVQRMPLTTLQQAEEIWAEIWRTRLSAHLRRGNVIAMTELQSRLVRFLRNGAEEAAPFASLTPRIQTAGAATIVTPSPKRPTPNIAIPKHHNTSFSSSGEASSETENTPGNDLSIFGSVGTVVVTNTPTSGPAVEMARFTSGTTADTDPAEVVAAPGDIIEEEFTSFAYGAPGPRMPSFIASPRSNGDGFDPQLRPATPPTSTLMRAAPDDDGEVELRAARTVFGRREINVPHMVQFAIKAEAGHAGAGVEIMDQKHRELRRTIVKFLTTVARRTPAPGSEHLFEASDELAVCLPTMFPFLLRCWSELNLLSLWRHPMGSETKREVFTNMETNLCITLACCLSSAPITEQLLTLAAGRIDIYGLALKKLGEFSDRDTLPAIACHAVIGWLANAPPARGGMAGGTVHLSIAALYKWFISSACATEQERTLAINTFIVLIRRERNSIVRGDDPLKAEFRSAILQATSNWLLRHIGEPETFTALTVLLELCFTGRDPNAERGTHLSADLRYILATRSLGRVGRAAVTMDYLISVNQITVALARLGTSMEAHTIPCAVALMEILAAVCMENYEASVWTDATAVPGLYGVLAHIITAHEDCIDLQIAAMRILKQINIGTGDITYELHQALVVGVTRAIVSPWTLAGREQDVAAGHLRVPRDAAEINGLRWCAGTVMHKLFLLRTSNGAAFTFAKPDKAEKLCTLLEAICLEARDFRAQCGAGMIECVRVLALQSDDYPLLGKVFGDYSIAQLIEGLWRHERLPATWHVMSLVARLQPDVRDYEAEAVASYLAQHHDNARVQEDGQAIATVAFNGLTRPELGALVDRYRVSSTVAQTAARLLLHPIPLPSERLSEGDAKVLAPWLLALMEAHPGDALVLLPAAHLLRRVYAFLMQVNDQEDVSDDDGEVASDGDSESDSDAAAAGALVPPPAGSAAAAPLAVVYDATKTKDHSDTWQRVAVDPANFRILSTMFVTVMHDLPTERDLQWHAARVLHAMITTGAHEVSAPLWEALTLALSEHDHEELLTVAAEALLVALPRIDASVTLAHLERALSEARARVITSQDTLTTLAMTNLITTFMLHQQRVAPGATQRRARKDRSSKAATPPTGSGPGTPRPASIPPPRS